MTDMAQPTPPRRHARLARYALWQLRDYAFNRGIPTLLVALLLGYLGVSSIDGRILTSWERHDMSVEFVKQFIGTFVFLGALFATNLLVSNDRKLGFYRFLFAKPVAPSAYYGTEFVVNGLCFLLLTVVLALVYGMVVEPVMSVPLFVAIASGYLCYAGLGFALSTLSRWDWLSLVAVAGMAEVLWSFYRTTTNFFVVLLRPLFPPVNRTSAIYEAAASGVALPWHSILWLGGYGLVAFIAGLAILRHRRLAFN